MKADDIEREEAHIRNAWIAGAISAAVTLGFSFAGSYSEEIRHKYGFDTWTLFDVAIILGLTYGIFRKSRFCALTMLLYFAISKLVMYAHAGKFSGGLVTLLFGYFYYRGTLAAFELQEHLVEIGVIKHKKPHVLTIVGGSVLALILGCLIYLGSLGPPVGVVPGRQLGAKYVSSIRDLGLLGEDELILYWYSDAVLDFKDGFYFFTKRKVVLYCQEWENPSIVIPYSYISNLKFFHNASIWEDSQIELSLNDNSQVFLPVSSDNDGDQIFYEQLVVTYKKTSTRLQDE